MLLLFSPVAWSLPNIEAASRARRLLGPFLSPAGMIGRRTRRQAALRAPAGFGLDRGTPGSLHPAPTRGRVRAVATRPSDPAEPAERAHRNPRSAEFIWVCLLSDDAKILVGQGFSRCQLATEGRQSWGYRQFGWISRLLKAVRYLIGAGSEGGGGRGMSDPCRRGCALRPAERRPASG